MSNCNKDIEQQIQAKGLTAPRVTPQDIDALMERIIYTSDIRPNGSTTILVSAFLDGRFYLTTGMAACVSVENFNKEIGLQIATRDAADKARDKLWELEGWRLYSQLNG